MPHIHVKIVGKSEDEKTKLAELLTKAVMEAVDSKEANITVRIEDIDKAEWVEKVYKPDIADHWSELYKKPGYDPFN